MTTRGWRRLAEILRTQDTPPVELALGLYTTLWGGWLALPWFDTFPASPAYAGLQALAPEPVWGCGILVLGFGQLYALLWLHQRLRLCLLFAHAGLWTFIALSTFVASGGTAAGVPHFILMALAAAWSFTRQPRGLRRRR